MKSLRILRIDGAERRWVEDLVTEEVPLRLIAGPRRLATLLCSPADLEDLVRGFFYTNGLIERSDQIRGVVVNRASWSAFVELAPEIDPETLRLSGVIGTGCGGVLSEDTLSEDTLSEDTLSEDTLSEDTLSEDTRRADALGEDTRRADALGEDTRRRGAPGEAAALSGVTADRSGVRFDPSRLSAAGLSALMREALRASEVHRRTGGVHMAALADASGLLLLREDIGRHNAVDKVIGAHLAAGGSFAGKVLLASGRLSSELLAKALRCGVPVLISRSAPTDRSIALARRSGLTLIGFARGQRLNVYSAPERVRHEAEVRETEGHEGP